MVYMSTPILLGSKLYKHLKYASKTFTKTLLQDVIHVVSILLEEVFRICSKMLSKRCFKGASRILQGLLQSLLQERLQGLFKKFFKSAPKLSKSAKKGSPNLPPVTDFSPEAKGYIWACVFNLSWSRLWISFLGTILK